MKHRGQTPQFRGPKGGTLPGSSTEIGYHRLAGLDQWAI